ncbi:hypothetical protein EVG20_g10347 [Dentipellis fragilis]|uniref:HNH nuclease domain-containing protein n=1 Tax=Dentipellis fragilis TaxID=205917 RepID=A0A4Y9XRG4_9AGAM|nr:hypothetical protein EVG20_g10347 [Dentipellis fragilis]
MEVYGMLKTIMDLWHEYYHELCADPSETLLVDQPEASGPVALASNKRAAPDEPAQAEGSKKKRRTTGRSTARANFAKIAETRSRGGLGSDDAREQNPTSFQPRPSSWQQPRPTPSVLRRRCSSSVTFTSLMEQDAGVRDARDGKAYAPPGACLITSESGPLGAVKRYNIVSIEDSDPIPESNAWGVDNLDAALKSDANVVYLRTDWANSLEMGCWTFVPPPEVLRTIMQRLLFLRSNNVNAPWHIVFPPSNTNSYQLVPLKLADTIITRRPHAPRASHPVAPAFYLPPYTDFPLLGPSTAHPYFVIYEALPHFDACTLEREMDDALLRVYSTLVHIHSLWDELAELPVKQDALSPLDAKVESRTPELRSSPSPQEMSMWGAVDRAYKLLDLGAAWDMVNVLDNSADCTIKLRKDWGATFEEQHWTPAPTRVVLRQITLELLRCRRTGLHRSWSRICDPTKTYEYTFVPLKLGKLVILRHNNDVPGVPTATACIPPYSNFPRLSVRGLHPYFVILSAWSAFCTNEKELGTLHMEYYGMLKTIVGFWYDRIVELREDQAKWEQACWDVERAAEQEQVHEQEKLQGQVQGHGHEQQQGPSTAGSHSSDTLLDQPTHLKNPSPSDQPPLIGQPDASEPVAPAPDKRAAPGEPVPPDGSKRR